MMSSFLDCLLPYHKPMYFDGRALKPYSEPVQAQDLEEGRVYFSVNFLDSEMLIPVVEPVVFIGWDKERGDKGQVYFQDAESFLNGVTAGSPRSEEATLIKGPGDSLGHIFDFPQALDVLLSCSVRRDKPPATD